MGTHKYANLTPEECNVRIKICDLHFPEEMRIKHNVKTHLTYNAVPSLNLFKNSKSFFINQYYLCIFNIYIT